MSRGILTGEIKSPNDFPEGDFRKHLDRFQPGNFEENLKLVEIVKQQAEKKGGWHLQFDVQKRMFFENFPAKISHLNFIWWKSVIITKNFRGLKMSNLTDFWQVSHPLNSVSRGSRPSPIMSFPYPGPPLQRELWRMPNLQRSLSLRANSKKLERWWTVSTWKEGGIMITWPSTWRYDVIWYHKNCTSTYVTMIPIKNFWKNIFCWNDQCRLAIGIWCHMKMSYYNVLQIGELSGTCIRFVSNFSDLIFTFFTKYLSQQHVIFLFLLIISLELMSVHHNCSIRHPLNRFRS